MGAGGQGVEELADLRACAYVCVGVWIDAAENMKTPAQGALGACPWGQGATVRTGSGVGEGCGRLHPLADRAEEREEEGWIFWTGGSGRRDVGSARLIQRRP